tara:strand:+ start:166 stop:468 length:303 start_codon:yes stop_codon:yes gene_type:complete
MGNNTNPIKRIDKELIDNLRFPAQEVLSRAEDLNERKLVLHRATSLGNLQKHKVLIRFEDEDGLKEVYTTIWAITDNKVLLKAGRLIPVHRIHSVEISYS